MNHTELLHFYQDRKTEFASSLQKVNRKISLISNLRLATALFIILTLYFGLKTHLLLYTTPGLILIFVLFIRKHATLFEQKLHLENLITIHTNELLAVEGNFSCFNTGAEFIHTHHYYTYDLDIFGEGSLFQYLNRISTPSGKKLLAQRLASPLASKEEIVSHQEAVKELASKINFCHNIQAAGMQLNEQANDQQQLLEWANQKPFLYGKTIYKILLVALPSLTISLLVTSFFIDGISPFVMLAAALQWGVLGLRIKSVNAFHRYISKKKSILEKYARMLHQLSQENFSSPKMQNIVSQAKDADHKVQSLASLVSTFDARLNSMTNLVVNSLLMYDLQCVYRLERWNKKNAINLPMWLETIRETEVLCSLATFAFNHATFNYPLINDNDQLDAKDLGHPLIPEDERVLNTIQLDREHSIMIITGANMAGKSTFLRTLGVNVVLALSGAPVCAAKFTCPLIQMRSGMRAADSLKDHQSYFYAELDRLKSIMDELRSGKSLLILLDEILRGTNSTDKQAGSMALVKQLVEQRALVIVATHDLALGNLEKIYPQQISNYCFEATIENDQLSFDYKLKPGMAQKMNATFLMKKMGIIPT
jgi:DNA mismatch repair ATPase MutS